MRKRFFCAVLMAALIAATTATFALPANIIGDVAETKALTRRGEAVMRFFGLKVYDIRLWTAAKPHDHGDVFALELVYDLGLKGREIAKRSIDEMRKQGYQDESKLNEWNQAMTRVFPDIRQGDMLVGVSLPGKGARFYSQEKFIAEIPDPAFAKAFFDIWLSPKTSEPALRARLIGGK